MTGRPVFMSPVRPPDRPGAAAVFTVRNPKRIPKLFSSERKLAIGIGFAAERQSAGLDPFDDRDAPGPSSFVPKPAVLLRLRFQPGCPKIVAGVTQLNGPGDICLQIAQLDPTRIHGVTAGERHVGAIAMTDYWTPPEDIGHALIAGDASPDKGKMGRMLVGVMTTGWSFLIHERTRPKQPPCTVARPNEFDELGEPGLQEALASLNDRFRALRH